MYNPKSNNKRHENKKKNKIKIYLFRDKLYMNVYIKVYCATYLKANVAKRNERFSRNIQ